MFVFTTAEKEVGEEARRGEEEEEVVEEEKKEKEEEEENEEGDEEEMERMGKAVILPSHLPSPASDEELLQETPDLVSATGDNVAKEEEEGSGHAQVVKFEEGSGEGSGKGASSVPKVIGAIEKPKQEKSVSGGDTSRSSNFHQNSAHLLLFVVVAAFWLGST